MTVSYCYFQGKGPYYPFPHLRVKLQRDPKDRSVSGKVQDVVVNRWNPGKPSGGEDRRVFSATSNHHRVMHASDLYWPRCLLTAPNTQPGAEALFSHCIECILLQNGTERMKWCEGASVWLASPLQSILFTRQISGRRKKTGKSSFLPLRSIALLPPGGQTFHFLALFLLIWLLSTLISHHRAQNGASLALRIISCN